MSERHYCSTVLCWQLEEGIDPPFSIIFGVMRPTRAHLSGTMSHMYRVPLMEAATGMIRKPTASVHSSRLHWGGEHHKEDKAGGGS